MDDAVTMIARCAAHQPATIGMESFPEVTSREPIVVNLDAEILAVEDRGRDDVVEIEDHVP